MPFSPLTKALRHHSALRCYRICCKLKLIMPCSPIKLFCVLLTCSVSAVLPITGQPLDTARMQHVPQERPIGLAWKVVGDWQLDGRGNPLQSGDTILPGGLLMPLRPQVAHSITLLLPDGQRILYECFTEEDCVRGFRIPPLTEAPSPFATHMLRQVSRALIADRAAPAPMIAPGKTANTTQAKQDEALVVIDRDHQASVGGLITNVPNGAYTYNLEPLNHQQPARLQVSLQKTSSTCIFPVPSAGLYDISIWDDQNTPRIHLFLAAIEAKQSGAFAGYAKAQKLMNTWNANYYGWPVHDLLRAYLEALMQTASPGRPYASPSPQSRQISAP